MYNKVQQRFDRSIREAVEETKRITNRKRIDPERIAAAKEIVAAEAKREKRAGKRKGWGLYLDPETGATVYGPLSK